ncbi:hypothetical protein ACQ4PT_062464 [Festuca glaucescens]
MEEATICTTWNAVGMSLDQRFAIIRSIGLESIDEDNVRRLLGKKVAPVCYVWCDPSPSADIWLLSMDHEEDLHDKLIRQYCKGMKHEYRPIILSHNKLPNLIEHPEYGKNGDPAWAIFMEDREVNLSDKLSRAFCPPKVAGGNPCLEYIKYIVFPWFGYFEVPRNEENGGSRMFQNMEELITDYEGGALDAAEVRLALTEALSKILKPVRDHFANNCEAKNLEYEAMWN